MNSNLLLLLLDAVVVKFKKVNNASEALTYCLPEKSSVDSGSFLSSLEVLILISLFSWNMPRNREHENG